MSTVRWNPQSNQGKVVETNPALACNILHFAIAWLKYWSFAQTASFSRLVVLDGIGGSFFLPERTDGSLPRYNRKCISGKTCI